MPAEKRENSVLFSLRELRQIEEDRVKQEEDAARQRVEDEKARKLEAERRAQEEEERKRREIEDAERARADEAERRIREEQLRLEETERKHRVEAQMRLEEQRLKMEIDAKVKASSTRRAKILIWSSVFMAVLVAGLGVYAYKTNQDRERTEILTKKAIEAKEAEIAAILKERDAEAAKIAEMQDQTAKDVEQLKRTQDVAEQERIRNRIAARNAEIAAKQAREKELRDRAEAKRREPVRIGKCPPNDPLCGIN